MSGFDKTEGPDRVPHALEPGAQLGKYTLERVLGRGGMGVVWAARDPDLERAVAIKLLNNADATADQRARLLREARAMARLKHPNVLTVYEVDSDGDRDFIAMELVEGTTLANWLEARPPESETWAAVIDAGRGLAAAHAAGLVHRDFKPHNVLRSRDGRVLVTDFGLARGLGVEGVAHAPPATGEPAPSASLTGVAETLPAPASSSVDNQLTATGAMMGTPAYMAPEQFAGAFPDPRTDQFAFCVMVWEALAGTRPYDGNSIEELRKAASAGVGNVPAKLPRAVRAALVRGLDPDPAARWPDLDAVLGALVRAHQLPKRRRAIGFAVFGLVAAVVLFVAMRRDKAAAPADTSCDAQATFDAWTPQRRAALEQRLGSHPNAVAVADAFDRFRSGWIDRFHTACKAGSGAKQTARLNCLLGERDDFDGLARLADTIPKSAIAGFDPWGFVPALEACDGDSPVAPPLLPEDRKVRDQIIGLRAQLAAGRTDVDALLRREDKLVEAAQHLGWKPLLAELAVAIGSAAQQAGDLDKARARFETAADDAVRLADYKVEAAARIGLLEVEMSATADPTDAHRADKLIDQAADAVQRAGNDPALAASVDGLRAHRELALGQLDKAIVRLDDVRSRLLKMKSLRVAAVTAAAQIDAMMLRDSADDLATAWQLGLDTERAIDAERRQVPRRALAEAMVELAWRRGDLVQVHTRGDALPPPPPHPAADTVVVTGTIVGTDGAPVSGALVVAWDGVLDGDATRIYTRAGDFALTVSAANGAFTIQAPRRGAIIAEQGHLRSAPHAVAKLGKAVVVELAKTHAVSVAVTTSSHAALDAWAELEVAPNVALRVRTPVMTNGDARRADLAGLPAGAATFALATPDDVHVVRAGAIRAGLTAAWPDGAPVDIVVHMKDGPRAVPLVVLRGREAPKTAAELDRRSATATDVAVPVAVPIGLADAMPGDVARGEYRRGDLHSVLRDAPKSGDLLACAANTTDASAPVHCATIVLANKPALLIISLAAPR